MSPQKTGIREDAEKRLVEDLPLDAAPSSRPHRPWRT
jgi:hypothetical protein